MGDESVASAADPSESSSCSHYVLSGELADCGRSPGSVCSWPTTTTRALDELGQWLALADWSNDLSRSYVSRLAGQEIEVSG